LWSKPPCCAVLCARNSRLPRVAVATIPLAWDSVRYPHIAPMHSPKLTAGPALGMGGAAGYGLTVVGPRPAVQADGVGLKPSVLGGFLLPACRAFGGGLADLCPSRCLPWYLDSAPASGGTWNLRADAGAARDRATLRGASTPCGGLLCPGWRGGVQGAAFVLGSGDGAVRRQPAGCSRPLGRSKALHFSMRMPHRYGGSDHESANSLAAFGPGGHEVCGRAPARPVRWAGRLSAPVAAAARGLRRLQGPRGAEPPPRFPFSSRRVPDLFVGPVPALRSASPSGRHREWHALPFRAHLAGPDLQRAGDSARSRRVSAGWVRAGAGARSQLRGCTGSILWAPCVVMLAQRDPALGRHSLSSDSRVQWP